VARPATVVVGKDGKVQSVTQYDDIRLRPDPEDLLRILRPQ
jgi:peroxiredoxin